VSGCHSIIASVGHGARTVIDTSFDSNRARLKGGHWPREASAKRRASPWKSRLREQIYTCGQDQLS
jgi:hypothetical protein